MKRFTLATTVAALCLLQSVSHAQVFYDLPNPGEEDYTQYVPPVPYEVPSAPPQGRDHREYATSVAINAMARTSGGTLHTIYLERPIALNRISIQVSAFRLKVQSATIVTIAGQRISIREFSNSEVINTGATLSSENLNLKDRVSHIEFIAEAYSGSTNISFSILGDGESTSLKVVSAQPTAPAPQPAPTRPAPPPPPRPAPTAPTRPEPVRSNDILMYDYTREVRVLERYGNDTVKVSFVDNGSIYTVALRTLSKKERCYNNICEDAIQMYDHTRKVKVLKAFTNNTMHVQFFDNGSVYTVPRNKLSKPESCFDGVCEESIWMYDYTRKIKVLNVYTNSTAEVQFADNGSIYTVSTRSLSKPERCFDGVCDDNILMYDYTRRVKVLKVYTNRTASVRFDDNGSIYTVPLKKLSKPERCFDGVCDDNILMYDYTRRVKVLKVYTNRTASVRFDDNGSIYTVSLRKLSKPL